MKESNLKIIPLGGLGEVGRNMMLYEYEDTAIIVDCGSMFPENDMLGIDYIIPDFQYLRSRKEKIRGIIFTHGHEDHNRRHSPLHFGIQRSDLRHTPDTGFDQS